MTISTLLTLVLSFASYPLTTSATTINNLTVFKEPKEVRPYVITYLHGYAIQAFGYALQFPVTNARKEPGVPVHIHTRYHETFFVAKGAINLFAQNETRRLGPLDIASVPPNTNHSFELLEPDTEILGAVTPGGFSFYQQVGENYAPPTLAPFPTDDPLSDASPQRVLNATGLYYDYNPTDYQLNYNMTNGTTNLNEPWHNDNNTHTGTLTPYFIAGGWGPTYLHRGLAQVVALYMTGKESNNVMTISTITMRAARANETSGLEHRSDSAAQLFRVLEGQLHVRMRNETVVLTTGDLAVVPRGVTFSYWSTVGFTRVYSVATVMPGVKANSSVFGVAGDLIKESETWDYAVFPDYYGWK